MRQVRDLDVAHPNPPPSVQTAPRPSAYHLTGRLPDNSGVTLENPNENSLRISDADRDRAASFLGSALAEGRLTPEEHSERLDAIFAAKTQADIVPAVRDLPGASAALATPSAGLAQPSYGSSLATTDRPAHMVAVLSGIDRKGSWPVPARIDAVAVLGGVDLDLRDAVLAARETRISAFCLLGGVDIVVPPEMRVIDDGWALLGGREIPPATPESLSPDAPVLRITGVSILGGLSVKRKQRKTKKH
jgi:uncharacterized protein DUF1707